MKTKVKSWSAPNYVLNKNEEVKLHIRDADDDTLEEQCKQFVRDIYKKAGREYLLRHDMQITY